MKKKAGKCKHIVHNDLCDLTKNWAREFDNKGEPLEEYDYEYCNEDKCIAKKTKSNPVVIVNHIVIARVRQPLKRIEYAYDKLIEMLNDGKIKLKAKDHPFCLGYLMTIKMALEEIKENNKNT